MVNRAAEVPPCKAKRHLAGMWIFNPCVSIRGFISVEDSIEFIIILNFDQAAVALCCITPTDNENASRPIGLDAVRNHAKEKLTERLLLVGHLAN